MAIGFPAIQHRSQRFLVANNMSLALKTPNKNTLQKNNPDYFRELIGRIDRTQTWVAKQTGISRRRLQYLLSGIKEVDGEAKPMRMSYPEQFILEALMESVEEEYRQNRPALYPPEINQIP